MREELCNVIDGCSIYKTIDDDWHKCCEDCPDDKEEVLVLLKSGAQRVMQYRADMHCYTLSIDQLGGIDIYDDGAVYWRHLPSPPAEEVLNA